MLDCMDDFSQVLVIFIHRKELLFMLDCMDDFSQVLVFSEAT